MTKKSISKKYIFKILNTDSLLSSKRPEHLTDEDLYTVSKRFLSWVLTADKSGGSVVDLAARVLSIFRQGGKSSKDLYLWQSMVKVECFLMNSFLPSLYHQFEKGGINIELGTFFKKALGSDLTTGEVKRLAADAWRESRMDDIFSGHPVEEAEEEKPKFRYRGDLVPTHIKNKVQGDLTEKEVALVAKLRLLSVVLSGKIDSASIGAAFKLIENFRKDIRADSERLWFEVIKPLEDFYVSVLHPVIHRGFRLRGDNAPVNLVFADALGELFLLFENSAVPTDPMDEAIEKAKRRGKWIKKTKKGDTNV